VDGTGPTPRAAEAAAHRQLAEILETNAAIQMQTLSTYSEDDFSRCDQAAARAETYCFDDSSLASDKFCFVTFDDKNCWDGTVLNVEDVGWKVLEDARSTMCDRVDQYQVDLNYDNVMLRRLTCRSRCEQRVRVSCPE